MGICSVLDLLTHYPRRYLDRTTQVPISELKEGDDATVLAVMRRVHRIPARRGAKPVVTVDVWDERSYLALSFFNQPWRAQYLREGMEVAVSGKVTTFRGQAPDVEPVGGDCRRRMDRKGRPDLPAVRKSRDHFHGDRRRVSRRHWSGSAKSRTRSPPPP